MGTESKPGAVLLGGPGRGLDHRHGRSERAIDPAIVKVYDFKRPDKFSKEQIRTVQILHETFARLCETSLSAMLRSIAQVRLTSVDQLTYEEFTQSLPSPCLMAIFGMDPLKGSALLEIHHNLVFAMIDRLFGGRGEDAAIDREITDIEFCVLEDALPKILGNLREAWSPVLDLKPGLSQVEEMPQFAQIVPPSEMIVLVTFEVRVGEVTGTMNVCLPYITIESIVPRLSAEAMYSAAIDRSRGPNIAEFVASVETEVEIAYECENLSLAELAALKPGSLVKLRGYAEGRAQLRSGASVVAELTTKSGGGRSRVRYDIVEGHRPTDQFLRDKVGRTQSTELEDRLARALEPLVRELGESRIELDRKLTNGLKALGEKQDEMADQLAFAPSGSDLPTESKPARRAPFEWIKRVDADLVSNFISLEHPQTIALLLSYMEPQKAAAVLGKLPAELQPVVARRIALMERSSPEVLGLIEHVLQKKLSAISSGDQIPAGGVDSIVEILGLANRSVEINIVKSLEKVFPSLAEEIKKRMFVFEDIVLLEPKSITKVLARVDAELLVCALKAVSNEVRDLIWSCVPEKDLAGLRQRFDEIGAVRLSEADSAQQKIVSLIAEMEGSGEIFIGRPGDDGL